MCGLSATCVHVHVCVYMCMYVYVCACIICLCVYACAIVHLRVQSVCAYRRPTFKCVVKRLRFRVFKKIANSIIAFWARLDSSPRT